MSKPLFLSPFMRHHERRESLLFSVPYDVYYASLFQTAKDDNQRSRCTIWSDKTTEIAIPTDKEKWNAVQLSGTTTMVQTIQNPGSSQPEAWLPRIIQVRTTITMLDTPLIPFALLKEDPIPVVEHYIETYVQSTIVQPDVQEIAIEAWNQPFAELSCNQNFFIYAWSTSSSVSPKMTHLAHLSVGIATPGPSYKRWFTTRAVFRQQALVAWCIEVDMRKAANGKIMSEIVLSEKNMVCLLAK